jgi:anti-sigma factor RsiW
MSDLRSHPTADLAEFAEGGLEPRRRSAVDSHLAACEPCRDEVVAWRDLYAAFESLPRAHAPHSLAVRIMAAIEVEARPVRVARAAVLARLRAPLVRALTWSYAVGVAFTALLAVGVAFVPAVRQTVGVGLGSATAFALRAGVGMLESLTAVGGWTAEAWGDVVARFGWVETLARAFETIGGTAQGSTATLALLALSAIGLALIFLRYLHAGSRRDEVRHVGPLLA